MKKFAVIGMGYVGLSNAILLSQKFQVVGVDKCKDRVTKINQRVCPIQDKLLQKHLILNGDRLTATQDIETAIRQSDCVIISTPTDFDTASNQLSTSDITEIIRNTIRINSSVYVVVRSTIPIGFIETLRKSLNNTKIAFCPEFLREGQALYDNLNPSRIVIGDTSKQARMFVNALKLCAERKDVDTYYVGPKEAEAAKLFSNSYLAQRVAFFNELDNFCLYNNLNASQLINSVSSDPRIGHHYNNPSFGYGGYCLPKDTKQLEANYQNVPHNMISAAIQANEHRKVLISNAILERSQGTIGIYLLAMKSNSDNQREAAVIDIIKKIEEKVQNIVIFDPAITTKHYMGFEVIKDLDTFIEKSDLLVANRSSAELKLHQHKLFTRDVFYCD